MDGRAEEDDRRAVDGLPMVGRSLAVSQFRNSHGKGGKETFSRTDLARDVTSTFGGVHSGTLFCLADVTFLMWYLSRY